MARRHSLARIDEASPHKRKSISHARRVEIIEQAMAMFGARGFNGLTIQGLAERCEISNAGLLYYFGSKDELLLSVLDEFDRRERDLMQPLVAVAQSGACECASLRAAVRELFATMISRFVQNPTTTRFLLILQSEATDKDHIAHSWFRDRDRLAQQLFTSLLTGIVPDSPAMARHLLAHIYGLGLQWLRQDQSFDLLAEWGRAFDLLLPDDGIALGSEPTRN